MADYPVSVKSFSSITNGDIITDAMFETAYDEVSAIEDGLLNGLAHHTTPDATANNRDLGTSAKRWRDAYLAGELYERGRSVAAGDWTTPSFSAGDYTGSGSMTWTVAAGDVTTLAYRLVGSSLLVSFAIVNTTVGGTPAGFLRIAVPAGLTATKQMQTAGYAFDNSARTMTSIRVLAAGTVIEIEREDGASWSAATDATSVYGQIEFEVS